MEDIQYIATFFLGGINNLQTWSAQLTLFYNSKSVNWADQVCMLTRWGGRGSPNVNGEG